MDITTAIVAGAFWLLSIAAIVLLARSFRRLQI